LANEKKQKEKIIWWWIFHIFIYKRKKCIEAGFDQQNKEHLVDEIKKENMLISQEEIDEAAL